MITLPAIQVNRPKVGSDGILAGTLLSASKDRSEGRLARTVVQPENAAPPRRLRIPPRGPTAGVKHPCRPAMHFQAELPYVASSALLRGPDEGRSSLPSSASDHPWTCFRVGVLASFAEREAGSEANVGRGNRRCSRSKFRGAPHGATRPHRRPPEPRFGHHPRAENLAVRRSFSSQLGQGRDGRRDIGGFRQKPEGFEGTPFSGFPRKRGGEDVRARTCAGTREVRSRRESLRASRR